MVSLEVWMAFLAEAAVLNLLPGTATMLVVAHALARTGRSALGAIAGVLVADAALIVLSRGDLGMFLGASGEVSFVLKWLGAVYLAYLGVRQWRAGARALTAAEGPSQGGAALTGATQGALVTLLNPRAIDVHIGLFPLFLDPGAPSPLQMVALAATFLLLAAAALGLYAAVAAIARWLLRGRFGPDLLDRLSGGVLIGAGLFLVTLERA